MTIIEEIKLYIDNRSSLHGMNRYAIKENMEELLKLVNDSRDVMDILGASADEVVWWVDYYLDRVIECADALHNLLEPIVGKD